MAQHVATGLLRSRAQKSHHAPDDDDNDDDLAGTPRIQGPDGDDDGDDDGNPLFDAARAKLLPHHDAHAEPDLMAAAAAGPTGMTGPRGRRRTYRRRYLGLMQLVLLNIVASWDVSMEFWPFHPRDLVIQFQRSCHPPP
jgi:hypothetical protein